MESTTSWQTSSEEVESNATKQTRVLLRIILPSSPTAIRMLRKTTSEMPTALSTEALLVRPNHETCLAPILKFSRMVKIALSTQPMVVGIKTKWMSKGIKMALQCLSNPPRNKTMKKKSRNSIVSHPRKSM